LRLPALTSSCWPAYSPDASTAAAGLPTNSAIGFRPVTDADFQLVFDLLGFDGTLGDTFCANDAIEPKMSVRRAATDGRATCRSTRPRQRATCCRKW